MNKCKIRNLRYGDCIVVAKLIWKLVDKVKDLSDIFNLISAEISSKLKNTGEETVDVKVTDTYVKVGSQLLNLLIQYLEDDLNEWFGSLLCISKDELLEMPFDTPFLIIEQLLNYPEADSFFTTALRVFNTMRGLSGRFKTLLTV
jgi:hypothetical protein